MFYKKFIDLCVDRGVTPSEVARDVGINKSAISQWKAHRNNPSDITKQRIANYFSVPVSYFDEKEEKPPVEIDKELSSNKYSDWQILAAYEKADENVKEAIRLLLKLRQ